MTVQTSWADCVYVCDAEWLYFTAESEMDIQAPFPE
jgi:hypothetical protein